MKKPKIICLCGSTRFYKLFYKISFEFTIQGIIVLNVVCDTKFDNSLFQDSMGNTLCDLKQKLDELHLRKIDLADEIFVINKDKYIGESTRNEINYAIKKNKKIQYLEPIK